MRIESASQTARIAPLVPTISAKLAGVMQPLPMLSQAPSPMAGNQGMPSKRGQSACVFAGQESVSG